jgi:hypothetical protein
MVELLIVPLKAAKPIAPINAMDSSTSATVKPGVDCALLLFITARGF